MGIYFCTQRTNWRLWKKENIRIFSTTTTTSFFSSSFVSSNLQAINQNIKILL